MFRAPGLALPAVCAIGLGAWTAAHPAADVRAISAVAPKPVRGEVAFDLHRGFLIVVAGRIGPLDGVFVLDTGATRTIVDIRIARALGPAGAPARLHTYDGAMTAEVVVVPSIRIGPIAALAPQVLAADLSGLAGTLGLDADGIVGLDLLRGHCLRLDYDEGRLRFGRTGGWTASVPLDRRSPYPVVEAVIEDQPVRLLVDTGSELLMLFERAVPNTWKGRANDSVPASDAAGGLTLRRMTAEWIWLGLVRRAQQPVYVFPGESPDGAYDGVLGPRALGLSHLQIDLERLVLSWREP